MGLGMRVFVFPACFTAVIAISGCMTLASKPVDFLAKPSGLHGGMTYFLPQRWVTLTAKSEPFKKAEIDKKIAAAKAAVASLTATGKAIEAKIKAQKALLAQVTEGMPAYAPYALALQQAEAEAKVNASATKAAKDQLALLNVDLVIAINLPKSCKNTITIALTNHLPDPSQQFVAMPQHSILRNDKQVLKVGTNGLLSSANVEADDVTAEIITEIAGAVAGLSGGFPLVTPLFVMPSQDGAAVTCYPRPITKIFDPANADSLNKVNTAADFSRLGLTLNVSYLSSDATGVLVNPVTKAAKVPTTPDPGVAGLFYRTPVPVVLSIESKVDDTVSETAHASVLMIPQAGPTSYIPFKSAAFVKTVDDVTFENGILTSWTHDRPSELLSLAGLPVAVAKALLSVPAELITLKVDYSSAEEALAAQQVSLIGQQTQNNALLTCLTAAGSDNDAALACIPPS